MFLKLLCFLNLVCWSDSEFNLVRLYMVILVALQRCLVYNIWLSER